MKCINAHRSFCVMVTGLQADTSNLRPPGRRQHDLPRKSPTSLPPTQSRSKPPTPWRCGYMSDSDQHPTLSLESTIKTPHDEAESITSRSELVSAFSDDHRFSQITINLPGRDSRTQSVLLVLIGELTVLASMGRPDVFSRFRP